MSHVRVRELKNHLSRYLKRVQGGEEILITERGRSVARIVPAPSSPFQAGVGTSVAGRRCALERRQASWSASETCPSRSDIV